MKQNSREITYGSSGSTNSGPVQSGARVLGVPLVLELDEGKSGRVSGHPNVSQLAVAIEGILQLVLGRVVSKVTDVDLAAQVPFAMVRHLLA